jgi:endonuclease YncB( thermonuclease family)
MFQYRAALSRVIDGDSAYLLVDVGFGARVEVEVRLVDVRAPERRQPGGPDTATFVSNWFTSVASGRRWPLYVETQQTAVYEPTQRLTFTRYLATVWPFDQRGPDESLNALVRQYLSGHPEWPPGE